MKTICCLLLLCSTVLGSPIDRIVNRFPLHKAMGSAADYNDYVNGRISKNPVIHGDAKHAREYLEEWLWMCSSDPGKPEWLKWLMQNPNVDFNTPSRDKIGQQRLSKMPAIAISQVSHMREPELAMQLLNRISLDEKALCEVVREGEFQFIRQLFELKEYKGKYSRHAFLPAAISSGNLGLVRYFLGTSEEKGPKFSEKGSAILEPLLTEDECLLAGEKGSSDMIAYLLNLLVQNYDVDTRSKAQKILIGAARTGKIYEIWTIFSIYPIVVFDDEIDFKKSLLVEASRSDDVWTLFELCKMFKMEPNKACLYAASESKAWENMIYIAERLNLKLDRKRFLGENYPEDRHWSYDPLQYEKYLECLVGLESLE